MGGWETLTRFCLMISLGGGNSILFCMFTPKIREDEPILIIYNIFQRGAPQPPTRQLVDDFQVGFLMRHLLWKTIQGFQLIIRRQDSLGVGPASEILRAQEFSKARCRFHETHLKAFVVKFCTAILRRQARLSKASGCSSAFSKF